jgi:hypothetical protein
MRRRWPALAVIAILVSIFIVGLLIPASAATMPHLRAVPMPAVPATASTLGSVTGDGVVDAEASDERSAGPSPTDQAVQLAYEVGAKEMYRVAVAVLDLRSKRFYGAGDVDAWYPAASLVKVFIAARLLSEGRADVDWVQELMDRMIVCSDDDAASALYGMAGGDDLMPWVTDHYGIGGVTPPAEPGLWGMTGVTARAMVDFYARVAVDPVVGPWLRSAMGGVQPYGCDGFYQHYGLPSAAAAWQVKQGWMCCLDNLSRMHSTGYVDGGEYAVALLTEGPISTYGPSGAQTLTLVAQTLLPGGVVPANK